MGCREHRLWGAMMEQLSAPAPRSLSPTPATYTTTLSTSSPAGLTEEGVRRVVREELDRRFGSHLVPTGAELRTLYRQLTGESL